MAVDMFILFSNADNIKGESRDNTYKDKGGIDVLSWSWGLTQSGTTHTGSGGGSGKASFQNLSFTKYADMASASLMYAAASGKHLNEAKLIVRKAGENPLEYMIVTMTEVIVTSISTGGSGGQEKFTENVGLNFAKVKFEYKEQTKKGTKGDAGQFAWDIAGNVKE